MIMRRRLGRKLKRQACGARTARLILRGYVASGSRPRRTPVPSSADRSTRVEWLDSGEPYTDLVRGPVVDERQADRSCSDRRAVAIRGENLTRACADDFDADLVPR